MQCDMCGNDTELVKAEIEGTMLSVCDACARYGKVIEQPRRAERLPPSIAKQRATPAPNKEIVQYIIPEYAEIVKKGREKRGLKQEELAKVMAERESLIHKVESGHFKPGMELARKFEKYLGVKIIDQHEEVRGTAKASESGEGFTLGDVIKVKKK
ncbi:TIGR00270 family protein [Candidatus Woesearchaeota archaeon]|nr:TIGR00270 family protein [Candidatus Woesearchaeota archaeon]